MKTLWLSRIMLSAALLTAGVLVAPADENDDDGFRSIFNGENLDGWDGNPELWRVEEGAITGQTTAEKPTDGNTFIIWDQGEVDDFELRLEVRIEGGNSGIQYRSHELPDQRWVVGGYQADFEAGDTWSGILYDEKGRGVLAQRGQRTTIGDNHRPAVDEQFAESGELNAHIRKGEWNQYHIIARGNVLIHRINGHTMVEVTDDDEAGRSMQGILALQLHAGPPMKVQFRNIELKRLPLEGRKKLVFLAGRRSHGYMAHEHRAGCLLLQKCLQENTPGLLSVVYTGGWPSDPTALDNADAICFFCDGGGGHPASRHLDEIQVLMDRGVGFACLHYGVEVQKGRAGDRFVQWLGGYFETDWSVNPHWTIENAQLAEGHQITRGVEAFSTNDEWYYHMRFLDKMEGVTAILSAVPPQSTLSRPDGGHSGNPAVRAAVEAGEPQHVAWATERPDGGRGFGYTGGHFHWVWANDDNRKLVLNALCWVSHVDVPEEGVISTTPTIADLEENQDYGKPGNWDPQRIERIIESWKE